MILNAYVIYNLNIDKLMSWLLFQMAIIESLAEEWLGLRNQNDVIGTGGDGPPHRKHSFGVEKLEGAKVCSGQNNHEGKRRRSKTVCVNFKLGSHLDCLPKHRYPLQCLNVSTSILTCKYVYKLFYGIFLTIHYFIIISFIN